MASTDAVRSAAFPTEASPTAGLGPLTVPSRSVLSAGGDVCTMTRPVPSAPARSPRSWRTIYTVVLLALDLGAALVTAALVLALYDVGVQVRTAVTAAVLWPMVVAASRAYGDRFAGVGLEESRRIAMAGVGYLALLTATAFFADRDVPRLAPLLAATVVVGMGLLVRASGRRVLYRLRDRGKCTIRVLVVGDTVSAASLQLQAGQDRQAGLHLVGTCASEVPHEQTPGEVPVVADWGHLRQAASDLNVDLVAFTPCPGLDGATMRRLTWQLEGLLVDVATVPEVREVAAHRLHSRHISGLTVICIDQAALTGARRVVKHAVDRVAALVLVLLMAPLMIAIAVIVRATSEGPALFRQTRVKRGGETFTCLKFRSMSVDADRLLDQVIALNERPEGPHFKITADPRITPVGRFLRRYSLDELPQLFNVLTGSMSLVGPRPPLPGEVARYTEDTRRRLLVKPGLTGLWQVSGRASLTWPESLRMELRYVENWSLRLDLLIICKTLSAILRGTGAF